MDKIQFGILDEVDRCVGCIAVWRRECNIYWIIKCRYRLFNSLENYTRLHCGGWNARYASFRCSNRFICQFRDFESTDPFHSQKEGLYSIHKSELSIYDFVSSPTESTIVWQFSCLWLMRLVYFVSNVCAYVLQGFYQSL